MGNLKLDPVKKTSDLEMWRGLVWELMEAFLEIKGVEKMENSPPWQGRGRGLLRNQITGLNPDSEMGMLLPWRPSYPPSTRP